MEVLVPLDREGFWKMLVGSFDLRLRAYAARLAHDADDIDELVWDAWQMAVEREAELVDSSDQWNLLVGCLRTRCADEMRRRRQSAIIAGSPDEMQTRNGVEVGDSQVEVDLAAALAKLTPNQRMAVEYHYQWGWPYWAVAAAIDVSEPTARVHGARGLQRLRVLLNSEFSSYRALERPAERT
jgi:RNA polymerase sigma factor (sigma-70 family)